MSDRPNYRPVSDDRITDLLSGRSRPNCAEELPGSDAGGCEVSMGAGRECGEPSVAVVARKRVCADHQESAADVWAYVQDIMRGGA